MATHSLLPGLKTLVHPESVWLVHCDGRWRDRRGPARRTDSRRHRRQPRHGRIRLRISLQDELERQFVWIEGVAQIEEGTHDHGELVPQLPEPERGCSLHDLQCVPGVSSHEDDLSVSVERLRRRGALTKLTADRDAIRLARCSEESKRRAGG
jgi:hypothetical protein